MHLQTAARWHSLKLRAKDRLAVREAFQKDRYRNRDSCSIDEVADALDSAGKFVGFWISSGLRVILEVATTVLALSFLNQVESMRGSNTHTP